MDRYCATAGADVSALVGAHSLLGVAWLERAARTFRPLTQNTEEMSSRLGLLPAAFFSSLPPKEAARVSSPPPPSLAAVLSFLFEFHAYFKACAHLNAALAILGFPLATEINDTEMAVAAQRWVEGALQQMNQRRTHTAAAPQGSDNQKSADLLFNCGTAHLRTGWQVHLMSLKLPCDTAPRPLSPKTKDEKEKEKKKKQSKSKTKREPASEADSRTRDTSLRDDDTTKLTTSQGSEVDLMDDVCDGEDDEGRADILKNGNETKKDPNKEKSPAWGREAVGAVAKHFLFCAVQRFDR